MPWKLLKPGERGPFWYVRGTVARQRFEISTGTRDRAAAEIFAARYIVTLEQSARTGPGPVGYAAATAAWLGYRDPAAHDRKWAERLAAHLGDIDCAIVVPDTLIRAANELLPGRANATKNREVVDIGSRVMHYAAEQRWAPWVRFRRFKVPKHSSREPADDRDVAKLLAALRGKEDARKRLLISMLYETGLRISDLVRIEEDRVDLDRGRVKVRVSKTDSWIEIGMSPTLVRAIEKLGFIDAPRGPKARVLFPWRTRWSVYNWLNPLRDGLGIAYTPHMSRHALATDLLARRIPDRQAAEHGGWQDTRSLHRYQHPQPQRIPDRTAARLTKIARSPAKSRKTRRKAP